MAEFTTKPWDVARIRQAGKKDALLRAVPKAVQRWIRERFEKEYGSDDSKKFPDDVPLDWFKLPYREPDGTININAVRNALARLPQTEDIPNDIRDDIREELERVLEEFKRQTKKEEASELQELAGKVLRGVALLGAGQPRLKGIPRAFRVVGETTDGRRIVEFPVAIADVPDPISGFRLTRADLEEMARNFEKAKRLGIDPNVKLDHPDVGPRVGDILEVFVDGNLLKVRAAEVPADALPAGAVTLTQALRGSYPNKSIEFWSLAEGAQVYTFPQLGSLEDAMELQQLQEQVAKLQEELGAVRAEKEKLEAALSERDRRLQALEAQLARAEVERMVERDGLLSRCADPDVRRHLVDILLVAKGVVVRLGDKDVSLADVIRRLILNAPEPPRGVLQLDEAPAHEAVAKRLASYVNRQ